MEPTSSHVGIASLTLGVFLVCGWTLGTLGAPLEAHDDDTPVVHVSQGDMVGVFRTSPGGTKFMAFYGIPYAKPPTGDLRFKAPVPAGEWEGTLAARQEGNICPQPTKPMKRFSSVMQKMSGMVKTFARLPNAVRLGARYLTHMNENCLFLNVYTPLSSLPSDALLPVLVFIPGGGFNLGSADSLLYGADYLMDKAIVVVTLNYRLGPLGFFSTNTSDAPGNAGLKDQRLAMRWVQENIKALGGDPARVTIYGESAGSYSAHVHVLSPGSKGLFRSAIMSSSMSPNPYGFQDNPAPLSERLAEGLGADPDTVQDPAKRVEFLRGVPANTLLDKMMAVVQDKDIRSTSMSLPWAVVVEPADTEDPVMTRPPNDILREGDFQRLPLMVGVNAKEGSIIVPLVNDAELATMIANPGYFVPNIMYDRLDDAQRRELGTKIQDQYFKSKAISMDTVSELTDLVGDEWLAHGIHVGSHWHAKHASADAPLFLYLFTLDAFGAISFLSGSSKEIRGAGHADDLGYVFKQHLLSGLQVPEADRVQSGIARMTELIANFVKDGNPTPSSKSADVTVDWPSATPDKTQYLEIGDDLEVKEGMPFSDRMSFWDRTYRDVLKDPLYDI